MADIVTGSLYAVSGQRPSAFELVFAAGVCTSIGPCVAPRVIAAAGMAADAAPLEALTKTGSMLLGLVATYCAFGAMASLLGRVVHLSGVVYAVTALGLIGSGAYGLLRGERHEHRLERVRASSGSAFFLGVSFALVVSPCCTPLVAGILAYTSSAGNPLYGSLLLACFACGHAVPVLAAAFGAQRTGALLRALTIRKAAALIGSTLTLALGLYYAMFV